MEMESFQCYNYLQQRVIQCAGSGSSTLAPVIPSRACDGAHEPKRKPSAAAFILDFSFVFLQ